VSWEVVLSRQAVKDAKKISKAGYKEKIENLLNILEINPFMNPPPYKKLYGDFNGCYSRRITIKHRLIYRVFETNKMVYVLRMWGHYE
jgi:toxin YoeB